MAPSSWIRFSVLQQEQVCLSRFVLTIHHSYSCAAAVAAREQLYSSILV